MDSDNIVRLPVRPTTPGALAKAGRPTGGVAEQLGALSVDLFYLARDIRCLAAHARDPVDVLTMAEWMEDTAREFGEQAVGDGGDVDGG